MTESSPIPKRNPDITLREEFDDWALLFNPDSGEVFGINPVGVWIWKQLDGSTTVKTIADRLPSAFSNVPDSVSSDVPEFVQELVEKGFAEYTAE